MPHQEYVSKLRDARYGSDKNIRTMLTGEQKKKLDQVEPEPHPELHGNVTAARNSQKFAYPFIPVVSVSRIGKVSLRLTLGYVFKTACT